MERSDVFIANVLKCRPPDNRDPQPSEIEACSGYLRSQIALIQPRVVCTLGNFSTKLLREDPTGITRLHGRPEVRSLGGRTVRLYPVFHPAAALYNPSSVEDLSCSGLRAPARAAGAAPVPDRVPGRRRWRRRRGRPQRPGDVGVGEVAVVETARGVEAAVAAGERAAAEPGQLEPACRPATATGSAVLTRLAVERRVSR